jgi:hypothetical protein
MADFFYYNVATSLKKIRNDYYQRKKAAIRLKIPKICHLFLELSITLVEAWTHSSTCSSLFVASL